MALRAVPDHPKFADVKTRLKQPKGAMLGWLESIWHFAGRFTPQGNIGKYSDSAIEAWVEWNGEPGALVGALVESGWLDRDPDYRLVVHDWYQNADEMVHTELARKCLRFTNGSIPNSGRLNKHERDRYKSWLESEQEDPNPTGRPAKTQPEVSRNADKNPKPEPAPAPAPEPEPEGQAREARQNRPPDPQVSPQPKSPGADGEFMAVTWLCEELGVVLAPAQRSMAAKQVLFTARETGKDTQEAVEHIRSEAKAAKARGEPVDAWYLADGRWRMQGGADGANRTSATHQRVSANKRAITEALARRGGATPGRTSAADGGSLPEPRPGGLDGGIPVGLRAAGAEILPPRSSRSPC